MEVKIPEEIKRLFWDVRKDELDLKLHRFFIIARIVDFGDMEDVKWMLKTYSKEEIVEVIKNRRGISRKSAIFWSVYLDIPREEIQCLKTLYPSKQNI
ncbi:MAG: hypothetical protein QXY90_05510 [Candidatus Anstonellales archaeon]